MEQQLFLRAVNVLKNKISKEEIPKNEVIMSIHLKLFVLCGKINRSFLLLIELAHLKNAIILANRTSS